MTQPNKTVEAVARALSLTRDGFGENPPMPVTEYDRDLARAAISAMPANVMVGELVREGDNLLRRVERRAKARDWVLSGDDEKALHYFRALIAKAKAGEGE